MGLRVLKITSYALCTSNPHHHFFLPLDKCCEHSHGGHHLKGHLPSKTTLIIAFCVTHYLELHNAKSFFTNNVNWYMIKQVNVM